MKQILTAILFALLPVSAIAQDAVLPDLSQNAALRYWVAFSWLPEPGDALHEALHAWDEVEIETARALLGPDESSHDALTHLHWAVQLDRCVWAIKVEDGPYALLPQLGQGRLLAKLAMLRVRVLLHEGDVAGAMNDLLAVLKLGRAFDSDYILISAIVGRGIEAMAVTFIAEHFAEFDEDTLLQLAAEIDRLPARPALSEVIRGESRLFVTWLRKTLLRAEANQLSEAEQQTVENVLGLGADDLQQVREDIDLWLGWVDESRAAYAEAGRVADLPYEEFSETIGPLEAAIANSDNQVLQQFMPGIGNVRDAADRAAVRLTMLRALIALRLDEPGSQKTLALMADPYGPGMFELVVNEIDGEGHVVAIRSALPDRDGQPTELRLQPSRSEPE